MVPRRARSFGGSDSEVIEQAEKILGYLVTRWIDFQRKYPTVFTDALYEEFKAWVVLARTLPSDAAMRAQHALETAAIDALFDRFDELYADIALGIQHAFPDEPIVQAEFGNNRKSDIVESDATLRTYISDFPVFWAKFGDRLVASGCPATMADDIAALGANLSVQKAMQGTAIDNRTIAVSRRIENTNKIWKQLCMHERYAGKVYGNGSADAELFRLDRPTRGKAEADAPKHLL